METLLRQPMQHQALQPELVQDFILMILIIVLLKIAKHQIIVRVLQLQDFYKNPVLTINL
ncbi:MAG: hypothetical protein ACJAZS_000049 [Alteromonas naphthalenivorans]|jgi:hypothetical protein